jgi:hypothetical protein
MDEDVEPSGVGPGHIGQRPQPLRAPDRPERIADDDDLGTVSGKECAQSASTRRDRSAIPIRITTGA